MEPRRASQKGELGFSMIELMVAMVVTLVVSGAIFGLLTVGGNAFRREPEVADRQQNIRIAMDAISRDIGNAGGGMPLVSQVFTHTDDPLAGPNPTGNGAPYLNGQGPQGVLGAGGQALRGSPPTGSGADASDDSDVLEILIAEPTCPVFRVCASPGGLTGAAASPVALAQQIPVGGCMLSPGTVNSWGLVVLTDSQRFTIQPAQVQPAAVNPACSPTNPAGTVNLAAALPEWPVAGGGALPVPPNTLMYSMRVVRYMIAPDLMDTSPTLWRSETGRYTTQGAASAAPAIGATNWQVIARGIEDLQVEYLNGGNLWSNNPGIVAPCAAFPCTAPEYNTVVRRVRVTLSARALAPLLQGETTPAGGSGPNAVRGQLVSVVSPRAAMVGLQSAAPTGSFY
jgi:type II secretory pathway pseudopilin PulG